jgi:hypothetical protein
VPQGLEVEIDISAPSPVLTPFNLRFVVHESDARVDAYTVDTARARFDRGENLTQADLLGIRRAGQGGKLGLGGRLINPERAAERLARGNGAASPGRARREARAEAAREANDPLYRAVKAIETKLEKLVNA